MNRSHFTKVTESSTAHYWTVGTEDQSVTLSALHFAHAPTGPLAAMAEERGLSTPDGDGGTWLFDVIQEHRHNPDSGWSCPKHGDACDVDAFVSSVAGPAWARISAAGVTNGAVYAELVVLHRGAFPGVAR